MAGFKLIQIGALLRQKFLQHLKRLPCVGWIPRSTHASPFIQPLLFALLQSCLQLPNQVLHRISNSGKSKVPPCMLQDGGLFRNAYEVLWQLLEHRHVWRSKGCLFANQTLQWPQLLQQPPHHQQELGLILWKHHEWCPDPELGNDQLQTSGPCLRTNTLWLWGLLHPNDHFPLHHLQFASMEQQACRCRHL